MLEIRIDSTTLEAHISYPNDVGVVHQAVETLTRTATSLGDKITSHVRAAKRALFAWSQTARAKPKARKEKGRKILKHAAKLAKRTVEESRKVFKLLCGSLVQDSSGAIVHYEIHGANPNDKTQLLSLVRQTEKRLGVKPKELAADRRILQQGVMSTSGQLEGRAEHLPSDWGMRLLNQLAVGGIEGHLSHRRISSRRGVGLFPETQVLKDLFDDIRLVDEADDSHLSLAFGTGQGIRLIDFSDEVGPALTSSL